MLSHSTSILQQKRKSQKKELLMVFFTIAVMTGSARGEKANRKKEKN
jgi:hypothetical protein